MFHHVNKLQFYTRVSKPNDRFAPLLPEQFGGPNGEYTIDQISLRIFCMAPQKSRPNS